MTTLHNGLFGSSDGGFDGGDAFDGGQTGGDAIVAFGDLGVQHGYSHGGSSGTTLATGTASTNSVVTTAGSGLVINLTWDSSVTSLPAATMTAFQNDVIAAAQFYETQFSNAVTVNLDVGYNEIAGGAMGSGALGESESYLSLVSYSSLVAALKASGSTDATDQAMQLSLSSPSSPVNGDLWVTTAEAKALGLAAANGTGLDAYVGFGVSSEFTYGLTNTTGTVAAGTYDFFGTVTHEISETLGRLNLVGTTALNGVAAYSLMDLTHYSAAGVRDLVQSSSSPGYASADGGVTSLGALNTVAGADAGDWASGYGADSYNAYGTPGVIEPVSTNDLTLMDALGWNLTGAGTPPPPPPVAPTGVALKPVTTSLASLQGTSGLAGGKSIATLSEVGGVATDKFTYTVSGAAGFTVSSSGVLTTASTGVTGGANGAFDAITVTAKDTTNGTSSPAVAANVIVGSANGDTIANLSSIGGLTASAPTFIYGLGGADTIDASTLTGPVYIDAGAGADILTGAATGATSFEYGATSDSTPTAMDIINNFNVSLDKIDLTGIGSTRLSTPAALSATTTSLKADSIGWLTTGGNTFVYVNNTTRTETLTSANMKIELTGAVSLTAANILHN